MRKKEYRGFTYNYDLGTVKVEKPIPKAVGKLAKKYLEHCGLLPVELMLTTHEDYDPLSSGSDFILFKGDIMLSPTNLRKIQERDFDLICIVMENDEEGTFFKQRDKMKRVLLRELVHIAHPDTIGRQDRCNEMVEALLEQMK
jgi:hypothetical protein